MPTQDSFDRQFRRTARSMRRRPAPRAWDRIETRLDQRTRGPRLFGIRPWMIAALVLLFAGAAILTSLRDRTAPSPLAQRAESMEELDTPQLPSSERMQDYAPVSDGRPDGYLRSPGEGTSRLTVSPQVPPLVGKIFFVPQFHPRTG